MNNFFVFFQIIISAILIFLILIQSRGIGLGRSFGKESAFFSTKRGVEKIIFNLTIILSIIFIISSLIQILVFPR